MCMCRRGKKGHEDVHRSGTSVGVSDGVWVAGAWGVPAYNVRVRVSVWVEGAKVH